MIRFGTPTPLTHSLEGLGHARDSLARDATLDEPHGIEVLTLKQSAVGQGPDKLIALRIRGLTL